MTHLLGIRDALRKKAMFGAVYSFGLFFGITSAQQCLVQLIHSDFFWHNLCPALEGPMVESFRHTPRQRLAEVLQEKILSSTIQKPKELFPKIVYSPPTHSKYVLRKCRRQVLHTHTNIQKFTEHNSCKHTHSYTKHILFTPLFLNQKPAATRKSYNRGSGRNHGVAPETYKRTLLIRLIIS